MWKRVKILAHCQQQECLPWTVNYADLRIMRIFVIGSRATRCELAVGWSQTTAILQSLQSPYLQNLQKLGQTYNISLRHSKTAKRSLRHFCYTPPNTRINSDGVTFIRKIRDLAVPVTRTTRYGPCSFVVTGPSTLELAASTATQLPTSILIPSCTKTELFTGAYH